MTKIYCDYCNKEFCRDEDKIKKNNFCCLKCYYSWLKINPRKFPPTNGKLNPRYRHDVNHTINCVWCKKDFEAGGYGARKGIVKFCSIECRQAWYANVWSQEEEWKQNRREWAIYQLEKGSISKTQSAPQVLINNLLDIKSIGYQNEKSYSICTVDNYLEKYNLIIEVMGTYFHCDIRKYDIIPYEKQVNRIRMDKIKHSYILNNHGVEILYLWEFDIMNNLLLCEKLIDLYINNGGKIKNYHSINYYLDENKKLVLSKNILIPYMDWEIEKINKRVKIETKQKMSKKQVDKWTIFNCENCNKEKQQLTCHYNKSEHHFCSPECSIEFRKNNDWHKRTPLLANNIIE